MDKKTAAKIASIVLFLVGFVEIIGAVAMLFVPPAFIQIALQEKTIFWAAFDGVFGLSRLIASYAIWLMKNGELFLVLY